MFWLLVWHAKSVSFFTNASLDYCVRCHDLVFVFKNNPSAKRIKLIERIRRLQLVEVMIRRLDLIESGSFNLLKVHRKFVPWILETVGKSKFRLNFYVVPVPQACTRWLRLTLSSLCCPLTDLNSSAVNQPRQHRQFFSEIFLGKPGIEPGAAGSGSMNATTVLCRRSPQG